MQQLQDYDAASSLACGVEFLKASTSLLFLSPFQKVVAASRSSALAVSRPSGVNSLVTAASTSLVNTGVLAAWL